MKKKYVEPSYCLYVHKVLRKLDENAGMSKSSANAVNSMLKDLFCRISEEASRLLRLNRRTTCSSNEILSAVHIIAPQDIAKNAAKTAEVKMNTYKKTVK
ncbi:hypothetical protein HPB47_015696 [Ixodes persulcatus]|uniref:Uncharacterized protein n=1 Tax=Ixodes persulcatus TaxID=34615 RepID=A0AC60QST1_IXOPE|nr:hypothetical protein HPB47_015696 [Ixodes persulcatus]